MNSLANRHMKDLNNHNSNYEYYSLVAGTGLFSTSIHKIVNAMIKEET